MNIILLWRLLTISANIFAALHLAPLRYGRAVNALVWSLYAAIVLVPGFWLPPYGQEGPLLLRWVFFLPLGGLPILIFLLTTAGRTQVRVFLILSYTAFAVGCSGLTEYLTVFLLHDNLAAGLFLYAVLLGAVLFFLLKRLLPTFQEAAASVRQNWSPMCVLLGLFLVTITSYFIYPNRLRDFTPAQSVSFPLVLLLFCGSFDGIVISLRNSIQTSRDRQIKAQVELLTQQIESQRRLTEEARRSRHDLRHHNSVLLAYAEKGDLDGLVHYLHQQNAAAEQVCETLYCDNETLNTLLTLYAAKAQEQSIAMTILAEAARELPITGPDLAAILANLLENALHGAAASGSARPFIRVSIHPKSDRLVLQVENSCRPELEWNGSPPPAHQGVGIESVLATAGRYGGECDFSAGDGTFSAIVLLDL